MIYTRIKKMIFMLLLMFVPLMILGCDDTPVETHKIPDILTIYTVDGTDIKRIEAGETFAFAVEIDPVDSDSEVIWSTSDATVATISEDGILKAKSAGKVTVSVCSKYESGICDTYKNEITVYDYTEDRAKVDEVISYLGELYQDGYIINGYFELPVMYEALPDVSITWNSSNPSVVPINGLFDRQETDTEVTLTARVRSGQIQKEYAFKAVLESIDKAELKSLNNKRLVFMYLYGGLSNFTKTEIQGIDVINLSFALINTTTHKLDLSDVNRKYDTVIKAHSYGIRVVLSIGGWGADGFSQAAASSETRKVFINSVMDAIKKYNYDGIDLDWEYPTSKSADIAATSADKVNFTLLCQELRAAMDEYKPGLLLTAAVSGSSTGYYEVKKLNEVFDYWHIMTYEYNNSQRSSYDSSTKQTKNGITMWIRAGATNTKVVLGVTFYGSVYKITALGATDGVKGLGQPAAAEPSHQSLKTMYPNIINSDSFKKGYDTINGMGYALSTKADGSGYYTFASFDTDQSLKEKAEFIKQANLAGIMSWELCEDTADRTQLGKLLNALAKYGK